MYKIWPLKHGWAPGSPVQPVFRFNQRIPGRFLLKVPVFPGWTGNFPGGSGWKAPVFPGWTGKYAGGLGRFRAVPGGCSGFLRLSGSGWTGEPGAHPCLKQTYWNVSHFNGMKLPWHFIFKSRNVTLFIFYIISLVINHWSPNSNFIPKRYIESFKIMTEIQRLYRTAE